MRETRSFEYHRHITEDNVNLFDSIQPRNSIIILYEPGTDNKLANFLVSDVDEWSEPVEGISRRRLVLHRRGKEKTDEIVYMVKDLSKNQLCITDKNGDRLSEFDAKNADIEVSTYEKTTSKQNTIRPTDELALARELKELSKKTGQVMDEFVNKLAEINVDADSGMPLEIRTEPYNNIEAKAEHSDEHVYLTDDKGNILSERATRADARKQKARYLIVTTLLFHGNEVLLQRRTQDKKIDPNKFSASAHGVAKEVLLDNRRIESVEIAAIINTALEINEELQHGEAGKPFTIKIWQGTKDELFAYAEYKKINDPTVVYLVPEVLLPSDGYPLGDPEQKRTRGISTGFIFSKDKPQISIDPAELSEVRWQKASTFVNDVAMTDDLQACVDAIVKDHIITSPQSSARLAKRAVQDFFKKS